VVVDVFFDHFLAKNWKEYSTVPLKEFAERVYAKLHAHSDVFPEKSKHILKYMEMHDWLSAYASIDGIDGVMRSMAQRTPFVSGMEQSREALVEDYGAYESDFRAFFPQLQAACAKFISEK
jgi:acyl carrier protein phosphodiesterase